MRRLFPAALTLGLVLAACDTAPPPAPRFYERVIQPILTANCVQGGTGACHKDDGSGNALGNLDLTSYEKLTKRRDVLRTYGSYPVPLMLLKASGRGVPPIPYSGGTDGQTRLLPSEIDHVGGATLSPESGAYFELLQWMANGAAQDGSPVERPQQTGSGECRKDFDVVRADLAAQIPTVDTSTQAFRDFVDHVEPVLAASCAFGTCHSAQQSDFFLACRGNGSDDASKFNFLSAQQFVAATPERSQIVLRPLSPSAGGIAHTGGAFYQGKDDAEWNRIFEWARLAGPSAAAANLSEGKKFFYDHVMPVLLQRGCALEACHSPGSSNDFKLRAGSSGFFPPFSLAANYRFARHDFLVPDVPDVSNSRLVRKPAIRESEGGIGIVHRGGPPLETPGETLDPTMCPAFAPGASPFCTLVEWQRIERQELIAAGQADAMNPGDTLPLVVVVRPPDGDRAVDFDTFRGGADLMLSTVSLAARGAIVPASASAGTSLLGNCAGVAADRANVDVRAPDPSFDAQKVVFAMRLGAAGSLDLYEVTLDAARTCTKLTDGNGQAPNGLKIHNFDPLYTADGAIVFASTRGKPGVGPTRSLRYLGPQADLWRMFPQPGGGYGPPEQMTALLGNELQPSMMLDGRIAFTTEKATPDFYQLSGRRINWDLTDYHPLIAQRSVSTATNGMSYPSVGYGQATEIREMIDRDFVFVLSDVGARGQGGALALFNRSLGPFQADRNDINFLPSVRIIDPAATGRAGATQGAYRSPFPLPDNQILVSYAPDVTDLGAAAQVRYDLVVVNPRTGVRTPVANHTGGASSRVEAVLVYRRERREMFKNFVQLVFGGRVDPGDPSHGSVHYPDLPMLSTLLGSNQRIGRFIDGVRGATSVVLYENQPPPADLGAAMGGLTGSQMVFSQRRMLGSANLGSDGSVHLRVPALTPLLFDLVDGSGRVLFSLTEEDQLGPGEQISRGVPQQFFDSVCGGCHGAVSGVELDVAVTPDALTGASVSISRELSRRVNVGP